MESREQRQNSHITYKQYKNTTEKKSNGSLMMFISAFVIMLLVFLAVAKQFTPDVDISIGNDTEKGTVNESLGAIQDEENGLTPGAVEDMFSPELEERVIVPTSLKKAKKETETPDEEKDTQRLDTEGKTVTDKPADKPELPKQTTTPQTGQVAKVIIGSYSTEQQAQAARNIVAESGLNVQPFIKNIGGIYTIQAGSFTSQEKAQGLANELKRNGFPARIISE